MITSSEVQLVNDINNIILFLSKRDIDVLAIRALKGKFGITQADMLIILGNSIPYITELGADAYKSGFAEDLEEKALIISYSPFISKLKVSYNGYEYINNEIYVLWTKKRFIDLIMGEIPRLRDDLQGYGPIGKGFISHIDIPEKVLDSYNRLLDYYSEYNEIKVRE